jgi:two-component system sensor kinase FixL
VPDAPDTARLLADLRDSEERLRSVLETAVDAIIVADARGLIESFNPAAERMFGYSAAEVVGRNLSILMPEPDSSRHDSYISRYLDTGERHIIGIGRDVVAKRRDGTPLPVRLSVSESVIRGERRFTGIVHDLTDRVRLEEQLREQASLARIGEMAAVLAHEVKNPLAAVRGAIQVIGARLPAGGREAAIVSEVLARLDALNGLMTDLLTFARPPQPRFAPVAPVPLLEETAHLLSQDPALAGVSVAITGSAPPLVGDAHLLKGVFLNLLLNGAQAMDGRGRIAVTVSALPGWCEIAIADEGPGIPADVRERIFAPFFTTKSRGTGLGLPTAKRTIDAHGGTIRVDCPASGGTVVTLRLPWTAEQPR